MARLVGLPASFTRRQAHSHREIVEEGAVKHVWNSWLATILITGACSALIYLAFPQLRGQFVDENAAIENLTALVFGIAAIGGGIVLARADNRRQGLVYLPIVILAALASLDEISYGETIIGYTPPTLAGYKLDAIHDLVTIIYEQSRLSPTLGIAVGATLIIGALGVGWYARAHRRAIGAFLQRYPAYRYTLVAAAMILAGIVADFNIIDLNRVRFFEELLELTAGQTLIFAMIAASRSLASYRAERSADEAPSSTRIVSSATRR